MLKGTHFFCLHLYTVTYRRIQNVILKCGVHSTCKGSHIDLSVPWWYCNFSDISNIRNTLTKTNYLWHISLKIWLTTVSEFLWKSIVTAIVFRATRWVIDSCIYHDSMAVASCSFYCSHFDRLRMETKLIIYIYIWNVNHDRKLYQWIQNAYVDVYSCVYTSEANVNPIFLIRYKPPRW